MPSPRLCLWPEGEEEFEHESRRCNEMFNYMANIVLEYDIDVVQL